MSQRTADSTVWYELLENSPQPVYFLSDRRNIVYCNGALGTWTGTDVDQLIGRRVDYATHSGQPAAPGLAAGLCPPPAVFGGHFSRGHASCMSRDGKLMHRRATFVPVRAGRNDGAAYAVFTILDAHDLDAATMAADLAEESSEALHWAIQRFHARQTEQYALQHLVGQTPAIRRVRAQIELAASTTSSVLIVGPLGSGCSRVARTVHYLRARAHPSLLLPLNCALLNSDAVGRAMEKLAQQESRRDAVTLWLQNVDTIGWDVQPYLADRLRTLPESVLLMATSRDDLLARVDEQPFREDLYCRLATLTITLPALPARLPDIPLLVQASIEELNREGGKQLAGMNAEALDLLAAYPWSRGLDQLHEVVREARQSATGHEITPHDLPATIRHAAEMAAHPPPRDEKIVLDEFLGRIEVELIARALRRAKGNKTKAAELLGMTRPRLYRRLEQLDLAPSNEIPDRPDSDGPVAH